jgi:hypothetical protein
MLSFIVSDQSSQTSVSAELSNADETREMLHLRTCALALINGRLPGHIAQADYEQARRELAGERDLLRREAVLLALSEEKYPNPT